MTQPTAGPYLVSYDPDAFAPRIMVSAADGRDIAEVMSWDRHPVPTSIAEALANARLIAAAPKMLAALRKVMSNAVHGKFMTAVADAIEAAVEDDRA